MREGEVGWGWGGEGVVKSYFGGSFYAGLNLKVKFLELMSGV